MKILHCPQKLSLSGAEFYFLRLSEELAKRDHDVRILTSDALDFINLRNPSEKQDLKSEEKINGLEIKRFPIEYKFPDNLIDTIITSKIGDILEKIKIFNISIKDFYKFLINGPYSPQLFEDLMKNDADLIHGLAIPYASVLYSSIIGNLKQIPKICTPFFHFENPRYHFNSYYNLLNTFDFVLTNSEAESNHLIKKGRISPNKIRKIFMAVDIKKYQKAKSKWFLDKFEKDGPIILFSGHKNYEKGALTILDCIPSVVKQIKNAKFVFIGPSTKAFIIKNKKLKKFKKNILNLGILPYFSDLKRGSFVISDIYVMPSRSEAFGISYLEAWACKKPVVASSISAMQETINDGQDGLLTRFDDPKDLAEKILYLLKNEDIRASMGKEGYNKIIKNGYTYKNLVNRIESIYKEALELN